MRPGLEWKSLALCRSQQQTALPSVKPGSERSDRRAAVGEPGQLPAAVDIRASIGRALGVEDIRTAPATGEAEAYRLPLSVCTLAGAQIVGIR